MKLITNDDLFFENEIEKRYLTSAELSRRLGLSIHTVHAWRKQRRITPKKFGRSVRWLLDEVIQELS